MDNLDFVVTQIVHTGDAATKNCYERKNQGRKENPKCKRPNGSMQRIVGVDATKTD
jgi:hypothetical protein